jgi:hypothetical protein
MFGKYQKRLTEVSNHYIDWSRIGELAASGTHRYSRDEIIVRAKIFAYTAAAGLLGAYLNNDEKTGCSKLIMGLIGGLFGFIGSHAFLAIIPLIQKRQAMRHECEELEAAIKTKMDNMNPPLGYMTKQTIDAVIESIKTLSLSNEHRGNASLTWGRRKNLLNNLLCCLDEPVALDFWNQEPGAILEELQQITREPHTPSMTRR